jgi:leucyl-tRNA synthetase
MDTFMCSSWYHLGYLSPWYHEGPFDQKEYNYWMPVDVYTGGVEHATMHLIYTRFFHKAMRDIGITKGDEPMIKLRNQGQILGPDGQRMSKSRGNVVDPDEQVRLYGADTVRAYLMFGYRWSEGGPWDPGNIQGSSRWLYRTWNAFLEPAKSGGLAPVARKDLRRKVHQTLRQVTRDFERFEFNTIISALMELMNELVRFKSQGGWDTPEWREAANIYVRMMAPVTPHIAEELWAQLGQTYSVHTQEWPKVDEAAAEEEELTLVVQVNGKVRDRITVPVDISREDAQAAALASDAVQRQLEGKQPRQVIVVPRKLVNIVL